MSATTKKTRRPAAEPDAGRADMETAPPVSVAAEMSATDEAPPRFTAPQRPAARSPPPAPHVPPPTNKTFVCIDHHAAMPATPGAVVRAPTMERAREMLDDALIKCGCAPSGEQKYTLQELPDMPHVRLLGVEAARSH